MKWVLHLSLAIFPLVIACSEMPPASFTDGGAGADQHAPGGVDGAPPPDVTTDDAAAPPPPINCALPPVARGATVPYAEYEAENAVTNGTLIGPSRAVDDGDLWKSIAGESSGRKAIKLTDNGQYVRFTSACAANAIVVRYVLPDSADGNGVTATLGLYVDGTRVQSLSLTSHYAWAYGATDTTSTTRNDPGAGHARHFYDEARALLPANIAAGAVVTLQKDPSDSAGYYVIDLVDLEAVQPPASPPANALSITDCGAKPDDGADDGAAIQKCLVDAQAQGKIVWIPPGTFVDGATPLKMQNVKVQGAGMWHSTLKGPSALFICKGGGCQLSDFSLMGEVTLRDDANSVHAVGGAFGAGSRIDNVWIEHYTTGPWIGTNGAAATDGMVIHGGRFRDLFADAVNFCNGTSNSVIEQSHARNTGDDAFASWAIASSPPNTNNVFRFNTVQVPWKANCFAIYGGAGNAIEDSVCADVVTYPGIFIDQGFGSNPFGGATRITRNTLTRAGGPMYGKSWGAFTVSGFDKAPPITGVSVEDLDIRESTFAGILVIGPNTAINGLTLAGVTIANPGTYGIDVDPSAVGFANATNVVVTNPGSGVGLNNQAPGAWTFTRGAGNSGW
jgi:hypothetical protein